MTEFRIEKEDPEKYKSEILELWNNYLPGTPVKRFEWMNENPDGAPIWYFAFDESTKDLAGAVSIMPRVMSVRGNILRAGIVGDFMITGKYRVYGPALNMQKKVVSSLNDNNLDFIYTIPNKASFKLGERAGLKKIADLNYFIKPISIEYYLARYLNGTITKLLSPIIGWVLKILSLDSFLSSGGYFQEVQNVDSSFDELWIRIREKRTDVVGNLESRYLQWRYLNNPQHKFRIITYRVNPASRLLGFIVFTMDNNKMEIFELNGLNKIHENRLIKYLVKLAKEEGVISISFRLSDQNKFYKNIRKLGFFKTKGDVCVLAFGLNSEFLSSWPYMEGNRNI